ncbi:MAG: right-handed parallel beta-helix repeat-containing protein [Thermotogae bacterium]|nr:right-handed parallel beta-helix repeat-containing protein [Thermotogota bacterium]
MGIPNKVAFSLYLLFVSLFLLSCGASVLPEPPDIPDLTDQAVFNAIMTVAGVANPFQYTQEDHPLPILPDTQEWEFSLAARQNVLYTVRFLGSLIGPLAGKYTLDLSELEEGDYPIEITASSALSHSRMGGHPNPLVSDRDSTISFWIAISEANPATVFYISPDGDDTAAGSLQAPWRTPYLSVSKLTPGDSLIFLDGEYVISEFDEIMIPPTGADGAWITLKGEPGHTPVIKGTNNLYAAIILSDVSYIKIENLEFTSDDGGFFRDAINGVDHPIHHIVLEDLYIHHIDEFGLNFRDVNDLQVLDCVIEYCGFGAVGGPEADNGGWQNILIHRCDLSYGGHYYQGIDDNPDNPYDRPDGFGIEPSNGPIEIAYTTARHNRGDGLDAKSGNTVIHHCLVTNNYGDGVKLWGGGSKVENTLICGTGDGNVGSPWCPLVISYWGAPNALFELTNVTIADTPGRQSYSAHIQYDSDVAIQLILKNCIFANAYGAVYVRDGVDLTVDHNHFYRPNDAVQLEANGRTYTSAQIASGEAGAGNTTGDPIFMNPAWGSDTFDYHLQGTSPAVDTGTALGAPSDDLDDAVRPAGAGVDKGCYERAGTTPVGDAIIVNHLNANIALIPQNWINTVKTNSVLHYARRSHGSQLNEGAQLLENQNATYAYSESWCALPALTNALRVWNGQTPEVGDYIPPEDYWATPGGLATTRSILTANPSIKYTMWSWCTELDYWSEEEVNAYLAAISTLEAQFPQVKFIYMTGNAQAAGAEGWNRHQRNEQIREFCQANNKILYDFGDLDCWYNGVQATTSYGANTYPVQHASYDGPEYNGTHVNQLSCSVKGKALWWLMARLEGWGGL